MAVAHHNEAFQDDQTAVDVEKAEPGKNADIDQVKLIKNSAVIQMAEKDCAQVNGIQVNEVNRKARVSFTVADEPDNSSEVDIEVKEPDFEVVTDPFALIERKDTGKQWGDKSFNEKLKTLFFYLVKIAILLGLLYLFVCSLDFLSNAFRLLGGKTVGVAFQNSAILSNPIAGLMLGVLATVLLQSSSTTTSIIVSMVAADALQVREAIFMIMGSNIGTTVTNTIVSMGHVGNKEEFKRAVAGATVHDFFNWLTVLVLLPIEWLAGSVGPFRGAGVLGTITGAMVKGLKREGDGKEEKEFLKVITEPFTSKIILLDKKKITDIAHGKDPAVIGSLIKHMCPGFVPISTVYEKNHCKNITTDVPYVAGLYERNISLPCFHCPPQHGSEPLLNNTVQWISYSNFTTATNDSLCTYAFPEYNVSINKCYLDWGPLNSAGNYAQDLVTGLCQFANPEVGQDSGLVHLQWVKAITYNVTEVFDKKGVTCRFLFEGVTNKWSDAAIGACLLVLAIVILMSCLIGIVKVLHSVLQGAISRILKRFINANIPCGRFGMELSGYIAMSLGAGLTMLLQSSSIFTSALTPLVGTGVLHINRMYPLSLGANIGTTITAMMAALAQERESLAEAMQVALCHLFFNIFGIMIWYPIPFMRRVPLGIAKMMGMQTAKYRWFAFLYLAFAFFLFPAGVFALSLAGWQILLVVCLPILLFVILIFIINTVQGKCPDRLPSWLRSWKWLPKPLHSLGYWHRSCMACAKRCGVKTDDQGQIHKFMRRPSLQMKIILG